MRKMLQMRMGALLLTLAFTHASTVSAGPNDTALPTFADAQAALHVYTAVGAIKNNALETLFICTNLHTSSVNIGVEFFTKSGAATNLISAGNGALLSVPVGATVTIASSGTAVFTEDATVSALPGLRNGSARVVATSKNISCTAMIVDEVHEIVDPLLPPVNQPPPTIVNLPLIRIP